MRNLWLMLKNFFENLRTGITLIPKIRKNQIPHILENFSRKEIYTLIISLLLFILSGSFLIYTWVTHQGPGPHYGGELTEGLVGQPHFINPILSLSNNVDTDMSRVVYAQLLKFDEQEKLVTDLAAKLPEISSDKKTYTLTLKSGLVWQDGTPLTADDVLFTIQTIQNPEYQSPLQPNWARVKVTKVDDLTLTFLLREASNSFINNFALGILPKHIWEQIPASNFRLADQNLKAVGSGPYSVSMIKKASDGSIRSITLNQNKRYYQGTPYLGRLTFKFYENYDQLINAYQGKEIQSLGFVPFDRKAFENTDNVNQYKFNLPQYQAVLLNISHSQVLSEKAVRQALWLATDRNPIIADAYNGNATPSFGPIFPDTPGYNPNIEKSIHFNLDEAANILTKGGWTQPADGSVRIKGKKTLEFNLAYSGNLDLDVKTAQILEQQWNKIGAKVNLVVVSAKELQDNFLRTRNYDAVLISENVGADPDPFPFWHSSQSHDPGLNFTGFTNTESDKLLTEARQTSDSAVKEKDYMRFQEIINDQLPAIFLVRTQYIYDVPKKLQGINLTNIIHPSERFLDVNHWHFTK